MVGVAPITPCVLFGVSAYSIHNRLVVSTAVTTDSIELKFSLAAATTLMESPGQ